MSIKISVVEKKITEIVNQYNLDEYYINESYGSVKRFNQLINGDELKNGEIPLPVFLSEIRPNNIIKTPEKPIIDDLTIEAGYIQHSKLLSNFNPFTDKSSSDLI